MKPINIHCCSWNVGDEGPPAEDLSPFLGVQAEPYPDVIFVGLQEVVRSEDWYDALKTILAPLDFVLIKVRNCWAIWIYAFIRRQLLPATNNIESELTAFGYAGIMGNKGACSIRMEVCGVNMACVSAHFTAHCENFSDRLNDYMDVIKRQNFRDPDVNVILDHDYVFWMGDLNFRSEGIDKDGAERLIKAKRLDSLLEYDQLLRAMKEDLIFQDFLEGPIRFPPTFKFDKGTNIYDTSKKNRVPSYTDRILYMAHNDFALDHNVQLDSMGRRTPQKKRKHPVRGGPTEQDPTVLNQCLLAEHPELRLLVYDWLPQYLISDHKPVYARFEALVPNSWFALPIRFLPPIKDVHPRNRDLEFLYTLMDPPPLNSMDYTGKSIRSIESSSLLCKDRPSRNHRHQRMRSKRRSLSANNLRSVSTEPTNVGQANAISRAVDASRRTRDAPSTHLEVPGPAESLSSLCDLSLYPPAAFEVHSWDRIGIFPSNFYDFTKDDLSTIFASTSSLSSAALASYMDMISNTPARSDSGTRKSDKMPTVLFNSPLMKGKIEAAALARCQTPEAQLIYLSKRKNCPQGYSNLIQLVDLNSDEV
ncbi:Phosphatidylinositol 4,5-bisphosphate 5-phosphatase A [Sparganum proliferum]